MTVIREAAVAGQFYPGNVSELRSTIKGLFEHVRSLPGPAPKALIVPHAGYIYSGPVAATAYAGLRRYREQYTRIFSLAVEAFWPYFSISYRDTRCSTCSTIALSPLPSA